MAALGLVEADDLVADPEQERPEAAVALPAAFQPGRLGRGRGLVEQLGLAAVVSLAREHVAPRLRALGRIAYDRRLTPREQRPGVGIGEALPGSVMLATARKGAPQLGRASPRSIEVSDWRDAPEQAAVPEPAPGDGGSLQ